MTELVRDAESWEATARARAKMPAGPTLDWGRVWLSEFVALQLAIAGVRPNSSKAGVFTRVLAVVQQEAGVYKTERTAANVERDARRALANEKIQQYIDQFLAPATT